MSARSFGLSLVLVPSLAAAAWAQGSVFSFRGLGWLGRPVSARSAGVAGAMAMFDPMMSLNPSALARWRSVAAWGVSAPTTRNYNGPTGTADQQTVRFPLLGVAATLPSRSVLGLSISDYLDRTWTVTTRDSVQIRGVYEPYTDAGRSVGGISDLALALGRRMRPELFVGASFHYYMGSTRLTAQRSFDNPSYVDIVEQSLTDYRGAGVGVGMTWASTRLDIALSGRYNGSLHSRNTNMVEAYTPLPPQVVAGLRVQPVIGVFVVGSAQFDGWSSASSSLVSSGREAARDVWSLSTGVEVQSATLIRLRTPLRFGYRWRQLPFFSNGEPIDEWAVSGGLSFSLAQDRSTIDLAFESGERSAASAAETFKSIFLGLTVRP